MVRKTLLVFFGIAATFGILFLFSSYVKNRLAWQDIHRQEEKDHIIAEYERSRLITNYQRSDQSGVSANTNPSRVDCSLRRQWDATEEIVFTANYCNTTIERWGDYIFFPEGEGYENEDITLVAYNLMSGERKILYRLSEHVENFFNRRPEGIFSIKAVDNNLYFSLGGYLTGDALYVINLPFGEHVKPKLIIANKLLNNIVYEYGQYWIAGGVGDGGHLTQRRALFDTKHQTYGSIIDTGFDTETGTQFIGWNGKVAYIAKFERANSSAEGNEISEIYSLNPKTLRKVSVLFSRQASIASVHAAEYLPDEKKFLVLQNKTLGLYDPETEKIELIITLENVPYMLRTRNNTICLTEEFSFSVGEKKVAEDVYVCSPNYGRDGLKRQISELKLPAEFVLKTD